MCRGDKMIESKKTVTLSFPISEVWNIVTDNQHTTWRSDIVRVEVGGNHFTEYTSKNFPTRFTITKKEHEKLYEFDLENQNMSGHWIGKFEVVDDSQTKLELIEQLTVGNWLMRKMAPMYLKKQQKKYIHDLEVELQRRSRK